MYEFEYNVLATCMSSVYFESSFHGAIFKGLSIKNMTFSPNAELNVFKLCGNLVVFFPHVDKLLFFAIVC